MTTLPAGARLVTSSEQALAAAAELEAATALAVDVESNGMHAFRPKLCFVQVASPDGIYVFDCLAEGVDVRVLARVLEDPARTTYIHAAQNDLRFLADAGVRVQGLFDTHRAATLLSLPKVGLSDLVLAQFGVALRKELQQSDFAVRPLPDDVFAYIADDVRYLVEIGQKLRAQCEAAEILEEVLLDCQRMADECGAPTSMGDDRRERADTDMGPGQAALAERLDRMRLAWAEALDVPFGRVLSNAALKGIVTRAPTSLRDLQRIPGVNGSFAREHGEEVLAAVREIREATPKGAAPAPVVPRPTSGGGRERREALKAFRAAKAKERNVPPSIVLPNALFDDLLRSPPESLEALARVPYFGARRFALYGAEIMEILRRDAPPDIPTP